LTTGHYPPATTSWFIETGGTVMRSPVGASRFAGGLEPEGCTASSQSGFVGSHFRTWRFPVRNFLALSLTLIATTFVLTAGPAHAQVFAQTWVSGTGDDDNLCGRTAPCKTFAAAISRTVHHGEINCLDLGEFGPVTIQKSMTIDCRGAVATIINSDGIGVFINFDQFDPSDTTRQVTLRGLSIQGMLTGKTGIGIAGAGQGTFVTIDGCVIDGHAAGGSAQGILDQRGRGALAVKNTTISNNGVVGILIASDNNGSLRAVISNTEVLDSNIGISLGADANVVVSHSVISNNATAGLLVGSTSVMIVDSTTISHNGNGIQNSGTVEVSNSDVTYNTAAISGSISSFSNNRFTRNSAQGGTIIPVGTAANPTGQQ
jgi:hypothetical protein